MEQSFDIFVTCTIMLGFSIVVLVYNKRSSSLFAGILTQRLNDIQYRNRRSLEARQSKELTFSLPPISCDCEEREYYSARGRR
jgi:hypothetical protein